MAPNVQYEKDADHKEQQKACNVQYDSCGENLNFAKQEMQKGMENKEMVKYLSSGSAMQGTTGSVGVPALAATSACKKPKRAKSKVSKISKCTTTVTAKSCDDDATTCPPDRAGNVPITSKIEAKCYEVKRGIVRDPCLSRIWQNGKYCRDDCGSGIVAKKFETKQNRRIWCKTPLTMYQATVGELGRKILCREKIVPRDVKPGPPCNVCEYILPPCRGYYRKYDCLRPCEEDYAVIKGGKKCYRDRVERYWEPCVTLGQKYKLDVNEYAPHNAALGLKLRRENVDTPCW